jgi:hypothetical protein
MTTSKARRLSSGGLAGFPTVAGEGFLQQSLAGEDVEGFGRHAGGCADEPVVGNAAGCVADGGELAAAQEGLAGLLFVNEAWGFLDGLQTTPAFPRGWGTVDSRSRADGESGGDRSDRKRTGGPH